MITRGYVVFPKTNGPEGDWAENVTAAWTFPFRGHWYGHVELWMLRDGVWYRLTATTDKGATISPSCQHLIPLTLDLKAYDMMGLPDDFPFQATWDFCAKEAAEPTNGYDWAGIWSWVWCFSKPDPLKWFCSEIVAAMLAVDPRYAVFKEGNYKWSPNGVCAQLLKLGLTWFAEATHNVPAAVTTTSAARPSA